MGDSQRMLRKYTVFCLIISISTACAAVQTTTGSTAVSSEESNPDYPGELVPVAKSPYDFLVRQKISLRYKKQTHAFEAILQKIADELTVVGLTPLGTKAFVLQQSGESLRFQKFVPVEIPFDPEFILRDIHRSYFWHLWPIWTGFNPDSANSTFEGERSAIWAKERVIELWSNGQLVERKFERIDGDLRGQVRIRYGKKQSGHALPPKIELDNGWFGYRLVISNIDYQTL